MTDFLKGVETVETVSSPASISEVASSIIGIIGTSDTAPVGEMILTRTSDDVTEAYGEGSINTALQRIHSYYTPYCSAIGISIGKDSDFVTPPGKADSGVTLGSSTSTAYIDDGASIPVLLSNPHSLVVAFAIDDETVATIDEDSGSVTPLTEGEAVVTVTVTGDEFYDDTTLTYTLSVEQTNPDEGLLPSEAALSSSVLTVHLGAPQALSVSGDGPLSVVWTSSNPEVATVSNTGLITPVSEGVAQISATGAGDATYAPFLLTCDITVDKLDDALLAAFINAVPLMLKARTLFGFSPKICLAPGILDRAGAVGAVLPVARKLRQVWFADMPAQTSTVEEARTAKASFVDDSGRVMALWPRPKVLDADGATVVDWAAPSWAGLTAQVDKNLAGINGGSGYWCSPSNLVLGDAVGVEYPLEFIISERDCEANFLVANGISTIVNYNGLLAWGNRSTAFPDATDPMTLLCWRRTADVIEESIEYFTMKYLDRPMFTRPDQLASTVLGKVQDSVNDFLRARVGTAIIDGKCWIDVSANPLSELAQGIIHFKYRFTPPMVTEHIVLDAEVYVQGLEDAFKQLIGG